MQEVWFIVVLSFEFCYNDSSRRGKRGERIERYRITS